MVVLPALIPATTPEMEPMVPTAPTELVQVPPGTVLLNTVVPAAHVVVEPDMAVGAELTVTVAVT